MMVMMMTMIIIIHQTHYEKSDWSRAFNQFIIACELDMINAMSAADIAFIMSSSTFAWLPSPLENSFFSLSSRTCSIFLYYNCCRFVISQESVVSGINIAKHCLSDSLLNR